MACQSNDKSVMSCCLPGHFRCAYGACIPDWMMCNGRKNCPDGSDETAEVCQDIKCKDNEFRCRYGACIPKTRICDIKKHCADGSDEIDFLCLITRAKMVAEWEKEEQLITAEIDHRKEIEQSKAKYPNSVLPPKPNRFTSIVPPTSTTLLPIILSTTETQISTTTTSEELRVTKLENGTGLSNHHPITASEIPSWQTTNITSNSTSQSYDGNERKNEEKVVGEVLKTKVNDSISGGETVNRDKTGSQTVDVISPSEASVDSGVTLGNANSSTVPAQTPSDGADSQKPPANESNSAQPSITCVLPEIPENTDAIISSCMINGKLCDEGIRTVPPGTQIQYECDAGYALYGAPVITCQDDGKWSLTPPSVKSFFHQLPVLDVRFGLGSVIPKDFRPRCPSLVPTKGTLVECIDPTDLSVKSCSELQKPGVEARFSCKAYYRPAGDLPVHYEKCGEDGNWSPGTSQQFACVADCGLSEVPKTPFIVNGQSIKRGQWPWHVGIFVEHEGKLTYICGGSLVTENAVLTSAHCVTRHGSALDASKFKVFLGKQTITLPDNDPFVQARLVSKIFVEEAFNFRSLDSDIAIMALETPAVLSYFVRPVCYPQTSNSFLEEYQLAQGNLGTVLGWGATENESLSQELRMTELPVISHVDCVDAYRDFFASMTRSTNYCAGYLNGTSLCNGDSGGGHYFKAIVKGATRWYIQGWSVMEFQGRSKQCSSSHYTVFTRVGRYADWIVRTLSRESLI
ncbi:Limulus clotting factor C [Orchesella cincta]|uniref:Limulus clotting factor C n=1 Tax=Orchesella cincta TaxID=48709 RepID=A0A1D2MTL9_ORCCI|nr:Limulus clotting factor C [Orchesella cincta]